MAATTDALTPELMATGLKLPPDDRYRFAMEMLASLEPTDAVLEAERFALKAELTRRWGRLKSGEDRGFTAEEVLADLRKQAADRVAP